MRILRLYLPFNCSGMLIEILWILFLACLGVQLFYILFVFGRLAFFHSPKASLASKARDEKEGVTVIIAAHNERTNLKKLIPLLFEQEYPNFEVMVINDRSYDGTKRVLEKMMEIYPRLRTVTVNYTPHHVTSKKYALTLGIKVAKNDVLLLTDADCWPKSPQWIEQMTEPIRLEGRDFALGFSQYEEEQSLLNRWIQFETLLTGIQFLSFGLIRAPYMGVGRNLSYRRSFFMENKAFKGIWDIFCGDDDLYVNLHATGRNTAIVVNPESITFSTPKKSWEEYFQQKKRHFHAGKYYRTVNKLKIAWYSLSHTIFWISGLSLAILLGINRQWEQFLTISGIILVRSILITSVFKASRKKLEGQSRVNWAAVFDLVYVAYFWVLGSMGYMSKRVRWK